MAGLPFAKYWPIAGAILLVTAGCLTDGRLAQPVPAHPVPSVLAFTNATVVDVETGQLRPRFTVIVTGNRITAADSVSAVPIPAGARVFNANGKYLIPGLTDTHVHLLSEWTNPPLETSAYFGWILADGVTSVREMSTSGFERAITLRAAVSAGRLLAPFPPFGVTEEMRLLVDAGLPPLAALQAATINAAHAMHWEDRLGSIEVGKLADIVLLDANPLEDITNVRRIHAVVADGRFLDRTTLDAFLSRVGTPIEAARPPPKKLPPRRPRQSKGRWLISRR